MKRPLLTPLFALLPLLVPTVYAQQSPQTQQEVNGAHAVQAASEENSGKETAARPGETATICFYRPHRFEGAGLKPSIYVDDSQIARLKNGGSVDVTIPAGQHRVYSNDKSTGIDLEAKGGQTYYVRVDIQPGAWKGHGAITLVDPQEGKYESQKTKPEAALDHSASSK